MYLINYWNSDAGGSDTLKFFLLKNTWSMWHFLNKEWLFSGPSRKERNQKWHLLPLLSLISYNSQMMDSLCGIKKKVKIIIILAKNKTNPPHTREVKWAQHRSQRLNLWFWTQFSKQKASTYNSCEYLIHYKDEFEANVG